MVISGQDHCLTLSWDKHNMNSFKSYNKYINIPEEYTQEYDGKFQSIESKSSKLQGSSNMSARREFSLSAYVGEGTSAYLVSKGNVVTKDGLLQSFKQIAAVFGWELHGHLIDSNPSENR